MVRPGIYEQTSATRMKKSVMRFSPMDGLDTDQVTHITVRIQSTTVNKWNLLPAPIFAQLARTIHAKGLEEASEQTLHLKKILKTTMTS